MRLPIKPEIWAGIEGTLYRVGDRYFDQSAQNGHAERETDIARFAELGIRRIRYPFLWESISPNSESELWMGSSWKIFDEKVNELETVGLTPIVGLLHHGSGPAWTSLADPEFPEKFAGYAQAFARRYPQFEDYTPINEPLTTALLSGLYGVWYPHGKCDRIFCRALYQEIKATGLAMQEIRKYNPKARLIQTEDMGKASGTPLLSYQAEIENKRRWLSLDLLSGNVTKDHPFRDFLIKNGIGEEELDWLIQNPCPPDIIGLNHHPLSNRYLDERMELYSPENRGGNKEHLYADSGTIESHPEINPSFSEILIEAWHRYKTPLALTEVHTSGHREWQLRWFERLWKEAEKAKAQGVEIEAVTAWSLLGSFSWKSSLTEESEDYDSGVFDIRALEPRPTAIAGLIKRLSGAIPEEPFSILRAMEDRPLLIKGASSALGQAFLRIARERKFKTVVTGRNEIDATDPAAVDALIRTVNPWAVINAEGYSAIDEAESEREQCFLENAIAPHVLAHSCEKHGVRLLTFSSAMVFDGDSDSPYLEHSRTSPSSIYGKSKAEGEKRVLNENPDALVVRTSAFYSPWDSAHFVGRLIRSLKTGKPFKVPNDLSLSPTYIPELIHHCLDLLIDGEGGIAHLVNQGEWNLTDFAYAIADAVKLDPAPIEPVHSKKMGYLVPRPKYSVLQSDRFRIFSTVEAALQLYTRDLQH